GRGAPLRRSERAGDRLAAPGRPAARPGGTAPRLRGDGRGDRCGVPAREAAGAARPGGRRRGCRCAADVLLTLSPRRRTGPVSSGLREVRRGPADVLRAPLALDEPGVDDVDVARPQDVVAGDLAAAQVDGDVARP